MEICSFKGVWSNLANFTVRTECIVIGFNVPKTGGFCRKAIMKVLDELTRQTVEEIFNNGLPYYRD
jgi:hypothetical protein